MRVNGVCFDVLSTLCVSLRLMYLVAELSGIQRADRYDDPKPNNLSVLSWKQLVHLTFKNSTSLFEIC
jgi:hypothetical protein